jgi:small redox-active disulfide protein 2
MKIEILGTGCARCETLAERTEKAARSLGVPYELCKVKDLTEIMKRGVVFTPALVIDGQVRLSGKVPSEAEIVSMLTSVLATEK